MKKVLVLNGSPKGKRSNTLKLAESFIEGISTTEKCLIENIDLSKMQIDHCLGCYCCWTKTPGKCVINDDMNVLLEKAISADIIIWSFPLYYFSMPSKIKAFLDRMLPTNLPYLSSNNDGEAGHPPRYDLSHQKHVLISTCGFFNVSGNYDALKKQFEIMFGDYTEILCPEGELFTVPQLKKRINEYLSHVKQAGSEYIKNGEFSQKTNHLLKELLYPAEQYVQMADASWDINNSSDEENIQTNINKSLRFIKQMAATYNPSVYSGKDIILEIQFTDIDKRYQLILGKNKCDYISDNFKDYTTRIETSYDLWVDISNGVISGEVAMMQGKYRVLGKFDTMLKMDDYFGTGDYDKENAVYSEKKSPPNMLKLLIPWIIFWSITPINMFWGSISAIAAAVLIPVISYKSDTNIYESLTCALVSTFSLMCMASIDVRICICASFVAFGVLWLVSSYVTAPLCAYYSCKDYGGREAFKNPVFIITNKILAIMWGILYFLIAGIALIIMNSSLTHFTGILCAVGSAVMGVFTAWFSKWYPARIARGK